MRIADRHRPSYAPHAERHDAIVIGGGQAGLATGQQLAERDVDFVILDAEARVGDTWRRRWDSLRLFTPAAYDALPGAAFPAPPAHFPDKDEVADYLERYAEHFALPIVSGARVDRLTWEDGSYVALVGGRRFEARQVVVATGAFQRPHVPPMASMLAPSIHQLHASAYRNPFEIPDGPALVVGAGSSGAQIALELARTRNVWLAGRDTRSLPRRLLGRDIFDWLWPVFLHATVDTWLGRRLHATTSRGGDSRVGIPERRFGEMGIVRVGRLEEVRDGFPVCRGDARGDALHPRVLVWATGYDNDYSWIDLPVCDARGVPRHRRGVSVDAPGLYFVGMRFQHRLTSSSIGGVGRDAAYVAARVARAVETAFVA